MTDLFLRVVELSWQAGVLALAVMLARLALRRAPKWAVCMLWALVASPCRAASACRRSRAP